MKKRSFAVAAGLLLSSTLAYSQSVYPAGTTIWDHALTNDGYTLFLGADGTCYLIDMDGTVVNTWVSPVPNMVLGSIDPVAPGHITAFIHPKGVSGPNRTIGELDYDNVPVWGYTLPSNAPPGASFHHDSERLPNGNTMMLGLQTILVSDISPIPLTDDLIVEVDPAGNQVWSWFTWQHATEFGFDVEAKSLISAQGGDWAHANSISVIPPNNHTDPALKAGNIIVSQRYTNTIFIIEKSTGQIVWKIGPDDHITFGQHFPHMIPLGLPGAGNILVFDNGSGTGYPLRKRAPGYSRIQEINPVTKTAVWTYDSSKSGQNVRDFWSDIVSSAQRLPNGNTMICQGARGRFFEIDTTGKIVWEYLSPFSDSTGSRLVFRAYRLDYSWAP